MWYRHDPNPRRRQAQAPGLGVSRKATDFKPSIRIAGVYKGADVLQRLIDEPGLSVSDLAESFSLKLPGMTKHLDVLSDAGLITRTKNGRTVAVNLSPAPMQEAIAWLSRYERFWNVSLDRLTALMEGDDRP